MTRQPFFFFFFFNDTATTEIYTLSLHDALPISNRCSGFRLTTFRQVGRSSAIGRILVESRVPRDRKSTRLNSSHSQISYAVFCLKKKNTISSTLTQSHIPDPTSRRSLSGSPACT